MCVISSIWVVGVVGRSGSAFVEVDRQEQNGHMTGAVEPYLSRSCASENGCIKTHVDGALGGGWE